MVFVSDDTIDCGVLSNSFKCVLKAVSGAAESLAPNLQKAIQTGQWKLLSLCHSVLHLGILKLESQLLLLCSKFSISGKNFMLVKHINKGAKL